MDILCKVEQRNGAAAGREIEVKSRALFGLKMRVCAVMGMSQ